LVDHRTAWTVAWLTWTAAALSILYFYIVFASAERWPVLRFVVLLTAAGIGPDLAGQSIEVGVLPVVAAPALISTTDRDLFFLQRGQKMRS
jgi:hypothetical protein